ncbi:MAG: hypothetical protein AAGA56_23615 [Myxococcota bacterium]
MNESRPQLRWLQVTSLFTVLVGVTAAFAAHPATSEPWRFLFDVIRWPVDGSPGPFAPATRFMNAILGGVMVGWGAMMFAMVHPAPEASRQRLARDLGIGLFSWWVVDSSASVIAGLPGNALVNLGYGLHFVPPLVGLARTRTSLSADAKPRPAEEQPPWEETEFATNARRRRG